MNFRSIIEIALPIVVLLIASQLAQSDGAKGRLATPQCSHDQLAPAVGEMSVCETGNWCNYVEKMLKNYKDQADGGKTFNLRTACEIHNQVALKEGKECPVNFTESCLPDYFSTPVGEMYDALYFNCDCPNLNLFSNDMPDNPLLNPTTLSVLTTQTGDSKCMLIDPKKILSAVGKLNETCNKDPKCPNELFTFDKPCNDTQRGEAMMSSVYPCLMGQLMPMNNSIANYFNNGGNLDNVSPCQTLHKVLDECFQENNCFSQQEMDMVRNMAAMGYNRGMRSLLLVDEKFGSITDYVNAHNDLTIKWHDYNFTLPSMINISDPTTKKALDFADHIVQDYNSDVCKENQKEFERMERELLNSATTSQMNNYSTTPQMNNSSTIPQRTSQLLLNSSTTPQMNSSTRNVDIFQWILSLAFLLGRRYLF